MGVLRGRDIPLRKPQRAHEPWVARHLCGVRLDFEVVIVGVASDPAARCLVGQLVGDRVHGFRDALVVRRVHPEAPQAVDRAVEDHVDRLGAVILYGDPSSETPEVRAVHVGIGGRAQAVDRIAVAHISSDVAEQVGKVSRRVEAAPDSADGERMHAPTLLPQIPRGHDQTVPPVDVGHHPVGGGDDEGGIKADHEIEVAVDAVVLPQRPEHEAGLILLDGKSAYTVRIDPRKPRAAGQPIRRVLVQKEPFLDQSLLAEREELTGHVLVAGAIE